MPGAYGGCKFTDKLEKIHAMTSRTETSQHPEKRAVSRSTLILAIVMTVAWFALVAIAITGSANLKSASAYGIDEIEGNTRVASR